MIGQLEAIHIAPTHGAAMDNCDSVRVVEGLGLEGDRFARTDRAGQIMLMPAELLERLDLWPGSVRENLTTRGIDVMALPPGTRLRIGEALLEATGSAPPCHHNDTQRSGWRSQLGGQRGLLCRAIEGGVIRVNDRIERL
jgi:MOSC domain-containing protein YiiM